MIKGEEVTDCRMQTWRKTIFGRIDYCAEGLGGGAQWLGGETDWEAFCKKRCRGRDYNGIHKELKDELHQF